MLNELSLKKLPAFNFEDFWNLPRRNLKTKFQSFSILTILS